MTDTEKKTNDRYFNISGFDRRLVCSDEVHPPQARRPDMNERLLRARGPGRRG